MFVHFEERNTLQTTNCALELASLYWRFVYSRSYPLCINECGLLHETVARQNLYCKKLKTRNTFSCYTSVPTCTSEQNQYLSSQHLVRVWALLESKNRVKWFGLSTNWNEIYISDSSATHPITQAVLLKCLFNQNSSHGLVVQIFKKSHQDIPTK